MLLKKLLFSFFFLLVATKIFSQQQQKIVDYKKKIEQQISSNNQKKDDIISLLTKLEKNLSLAEEKLANSEEKVINLEKKIFNNKKKLDDTNNQLQKTIQGIYQSFLGFYLLKKIQEHSILPSLDYIQNYKRNQKVVETILKKDIQISKGLKKQAKKKEEQQDLWNQNKTKLQKELSIFKSNQEEMNFSKRQYSLFLEKIEIQQKKDEQILLEINKKLASAFFVPNNITKKENSRNSIFPAKGKILETFGKQNTSIPFYHKNGILLQTNLSEKVQATQEGKIVFIDNLPRYNLLLIIQHSNTEFSTYGRLFNTTVKIGDRVKKNQIIGEVASYDGKMGILYYAKRKDGKPVDPIK